MNFISDMRLTLRFGSTVFGISAIFLIIFPKFFLGLLDLSANSDLIWSMQMISITLIALAGNMLIVSVTAPDKGVINSALIMMISATGLGVLTLLIPADLNWFSIVYSTIGFAFGAIYATLLLRWRSSR